MKHGLSRRLAVGNIRKNYRFFIPRILTETGLLACFYIIFTLACDERLSRIRGGDYLPTFMWMGAVVIGLLSLIVMLYTNSFLMKQRKHEFGLYSVLGMEKRHICRILLHESLVCSAASIAAGLLAGILFYKLSSLAICKLLKAEVVAGFYFISLKTILPAGAAFFGIDAFSYLINCIGIRRMKPAELLSSAGTGEKEPKNKWLLLAFGLATLGAGYFLSLTTKNPLEALLVFFAAVLLVILGTYFLFTAGSVFVLKTLKKSERYYYQPGHFTAVSGLLYRMKQNAVGLASVAILATGVLIMSASTLCLYTKAENTLKDRYPQDYYLSTVFYDEQDRRTEIPEERITETVRAYAKKNGLDIRDGCFQTFFEASFSHRPGELISDRASISEEIRLSELCNITFMTEASYVGMGGDPIGLKKDEVAVSSYQISAAFSDPSFTLFGSEYRVAEELTYFPISNALISTNCFGMIVADDAVFGEIFRAQQQAYGENASQMQSRYCVSFEDRQKVLERGEVFSREVSDSIEHYIVSLGISRYSAPTVDSVWQARESLYGMFGTLLFLGILLGLVCLFATVLILYYKQISEGYEDRSRYQILRKIGLSDKEVKNTVRAQTTLMFFLPLVTAGVHVAFAFPILSRMMEILLMDNRWLFAKWCLIIYIVFAAVYTVIYRLTARTYYKIVY